MEKTLSLAVLLALWVLPGPALAHPSGGPAVAWPTDPRTVGQVVDSSYTFSWVDTNYPATTGTVTIDWFYTRSMPPTFVAGTSPPDLEGTPIILGIPEPDRSDRYTWNTSTVAPGSYFLFSKVNDLPGETSIRIVAFSRGVVTIAHPGDVVHPAVVVTQPNNPFVIADQEFLVTYEAFDPDGTGKVELAAMQRRDGSDAVILARDLPATRTGTFTWSLSQLAEGDWIIRAALTDDRSLSFTSYARFLLRVEHGPSGLDGGAVGGDAGTAFNDAAAQGPDGEVPPGAVEPLGGDDGCSCRLAPPPRHASLAWLLSLVALGASLRARAGGCSRAESAGSAPPGRRRRSDSARPPG